MTAAMVPVEVKQAYSDAIERYDMLGAWSAAVELSSWAGDLLQRVPPELPYSLSWKAGRRCWFDLAEFVAAMFAARADALPSWRRIHAQWLMERGFSSEAQSRLERLLEQPDAGPFDRAQAFGHLGRIHKERFVRARRKGDAEGARVHIERAIDAYLRGWRDRGNPEPSWHGTNALALLRCTEARESRVARDVDANAMVSRVQAELPKGSLYYDATLAELALVTGDFAGALEHVRRLAQGRDQGAQQFELGSTLRQFEQVWRLDSAPSPGPEVLTLLRAAVLARGPGRVDLTAVNTAHAKEKGLYEGVQGGERFTPVDVYGLGLQRAACVARIGLNTTRGEGTGFLLHGRALAERMPDRWLLVTNAHVLSERESERAAGALHPSEAVVTFEKSDVIDRREQFRIEGSLLFSSPRDELDVAIAALSSPVAPSSDLPMAHVLPVRSAKEIFHVIGHSDGGPLVISSNRMLDHESPRLHYITATEGGHSGSPVFNSQWKLIGIHHYHHSAMPRLNGEAGTYWANEGMWIGAVREAVGAAT